MDATVALPPQYAQAEQLAADMLLAATLKDWDRVRQLQSRIPELARSLACDWSALCAADPDAARLLEPARLRAMQRVLRIDARIRHVADPLAALLDRLLQPTLHRA